MVPSSARAASVALCLAVLLPSAVRGLRAPSARPRCAPEGRGEGSRIWIGCAADPGPPRALTGHERRLMGLPIDVNEATAEDLAGVPGLSPKLAAEIAAERARGGPFARLEDLLRVRGVGPARLEKARPFLTLER